jgi:hypothetical protein
VSTLRNLVDSGRRDDAVRHLRNDLLPSGADISVLVEDLIAALSRD